MTVWRISKEIYKASAFAGVGGLYSSGRWHQKGVRIVYSSSSISLATLEVFVHLDLTQRLTSYVLSSAIIPDDVLISSVSNADLPDNWRSKPLNPGVRAIGINWLTRCQSAILKVPSVMSEGEFNYLLNPAHDDFARIQVGEERPFSFDERMWKVHAPDSPSLVPTVPLCPLCGTWPHNAHYFSATDVGFGQAALEAAGMSKRARRKPAVSKRQKTKLGLPDLDHSEAAVRDSLCSPEPKPFSFRIAASRRRRLTANLRPSAG